MSIWHPLGRIHELYSLLDGFTGEKQGFILGVKDISGPSHEGVCLSEQGELETPRNNRTHVGRVHLCENTPKGKI